MTKSTLFVAVIASVIYLLSHTNAVHAQRHQLSAELCSAKLPTARYGMASVYDGDDTIYLFGGTATRAAAVNETLKYSISKDTIEIAGQLPVPTQSRAAAVMSRFKNIFYFQGGSNKDIFQYFPDTQSFANVSSFEEFNILFASTTPPDTDTSLIFTVRNNYQDLIVSSLDLNTLIVEKMGSYTGRVDFPEAVWMSRNNLVYIFTSGDILTYNRASNQFTSLRKSLGMYPKGVSDGRYIYLFGELRGDPTGIQILNPDDNSIENVEVENKPPMSYATVVYVEKLNRIYSFGGASSWELDGPIWDDIYYISLDPMSETPTTTEDSPPITTLDPDVFNCGGRPDAVYSYPGECARFVVCREGHGYAFDCPEPLLFHPINRQCTWPDWVDCTATV